MFVMLRPSMGEPMACAFDAVWAREVFDPEPVPLPAPGSCASSNSEEPCVYRFSVISERDDWDLCIRVGFCEAGQPCEPAPPDDPNAFELWYELQHPFYLGKRTYWHLYLQQWAPHCEVQPPARRCVVTVDRCNIRGCSDGAELDPGPTDPSEPLMPDDDFCLGGGQHFCEI